MGLADFTWGYSSFYFYLRGQKEEKRKEAIKILDERYAKGEIKEEEYEKSKTMIYDGKH